MSENKLKIVYRKVEDLIPAEYNPKKCSAKEFEDIKASIKRFGFVDPIIINMHKDRMNIVIGGHQRLKVAKEIGLDVVPCVEMDLPLDKEKELNIRLSKNHASIDDELLTKYFQKDFLKDVGFVDSELKMFLSEFEKKFNQADNTNCAYPIVPKFSEKYDAVIIVSKNMIDTTFLETALEIQTSQSYKNQRTGKAMIISVEQFKKVWTQDKE